MINELKELFSNLNDTCVYVVLRNWDDIFNESIYGSGHEDIDILCDDKMLFLETVGAVPVHKNKHRDNFIVPCGTSMLRFDVRWVGDGYYPKEWEMNMLKNRLLNKDGIYIMSKEDYCYSLAYHALFQKPSLSKEYMNKIQVAYKSTGNDLVIQDQFELLDVLRLFMDNNSYKYVISSDPAVFVNWQNVKKIKTQLSFYYLFRRFAYHINNYLFR